MFCFNFKIEEFSHVVIKDESQIFRATTSPGGGIFESREEALRVKELVENMTIKNTRSRLEILVTCGEIKEYDERVHLNWSIEDHLETYDNIKKRYERSYEFEGAEELSFDPDNDVLSHKDFHAWEKKMGVEFTNG